MLPAPDRQRWLETLAHDLLSGREALERALAQVLEDSGYAVDALFEIALRKVMAGLQDPEEREALARAVADALAGRQSKGPEAGAPGQAPSGQGRSDGRN